MWLSKTISRISILLFLASVGDMGSAAEVKPDFTPLKYLMAKELVERELPSVSVTLSLDGQTVFNQAVGFADLERLDLATTDTSYLLASVSKIFTGAAILSLVEQGHLDLDAPANSYLSGAKIQAHLGDQAHITVRRLANHTAGLPLHYHFFYPDQVPVRPEMDVSIRKFGHTVLPPGERFLYSNFGYGILDYLIELRSGLTFGEYLHREFFEPLSMRRSGTVSGVSKLSEVATLYGSGAKRIPWYDFDHRGASAVLASTSDLVRFGEWFLGVSKSTSQIALSRESLKAMVAPESLPQKDGDQQYGLGINVRRSNGDLIYSHSGRMPGVAATLTMLPERDFVIAIAINSSAPGSLAALNRVKEGAIAILTGGREPEQKPAKPNACIRAMTEPVKVPLGLAGEWFGAIQTDEGDINLTLSIDPEGRSVASSQAQDSLPLVFCEESEGIATFALPTMRIATTDAKRYPHGVLLNLANRQGKLSGSATAFGVPGLEPMGSALSYWVSLRNSN